MSVQWILSDSRRFVQPAQAILIERRANVNTRGILYLLARLLGDGRAVSRGTVGKRIARRAAGKAAGRILWRLFR